MKLIVASLLASCCLASAAPNFGFIYPAGGQRGTTAYYIAGGQFLGQKVFAESPGIRVLSVEHVPNFNPGALSPEQKKFLFSWVNAAATPGQTPPEIPEAIQDDNWLKNPWLKNLAALTPFQRKLLIYMVRERKNPLQATPSLNQLSIVEIEIAPDAPLGPSDLRFAGRGGLSQPKQFFVDATPHASEPFYSPQSRPPLKRRKTKADSLAPNPSAESDSPELSVPRFPSILDGLIRPGEIDSWSVSLAAGKPYSFVVNARKLTPFIGDAVPGHFQPVLRLLDPSGQEVAFADDEGNDPDPILRFTPKSPGDYTLQISDSLFRGRNDFVYRISCAQANAPRAFSDPFPGLTRRLSARAAAAKPLKPDATTIIEGALDTAPAQSFSVRLEAGQSLVADLAAERADSPLDSILRIYAPDGRLVAENDDAPAPFLTGTRLRQSDSYICYQAPQPGIYRVEVANRLSRGGRDFRYWLRLGPPSPDFRVFLTQSSLAFNPQTLEGSFTCKIEPLDGFKGDIAFDSDSIECQPPTPDAKAPGLFLVRFKFRESPRTLRVNGGAVPVELTATSQIPGKTPLRHSVIPCDTYTQAFATEHLLPARQLLLAIERPQRDTSQKTAKPKAAPAPQPPARESAPDKPDGPRRKPAAAKPAN